MSTKDDLTAAELAAQVVKNAQKDRHQSETYLEEILLELQKQGNNFGFKDYARELSKLLDNKSRSNEQILKTASLLNKREMEHDADFSEDDLYEHLEEIDKQQKEQQEEEMDGEKED